VGHLRRGPRLGDRHSRRYRGRDRPAFHRRHFTSIRQLQAEADAWLVTYNHRRRNHGDYMRGRTPSQVLDNHKKNKAA